MMSSRGRILGGAGLRLVLWLSSAGALGAQGGAARSVSGPEDPCGDPSGRHAPPAAPHPHRDSARSAVAPSPPTAALPDTAFLQHMIVHHAQALDMAALVPERSASPVLRLLADRITVSQRDEIATMRRWLADHHVGASRAEGTLPGSPSGTAHAAHGVSPGADSATMPGLLTPQRLRALAALSGAAFEREFLRAMIAHHEGALLMVRALFATPGAGQDPSVFTLASDIESDQRAEIARMHTLLGTLPFRPPPR